LPSHIRPGAVNWGFVQFAVFWISAKEAAIPLGAGIKCVDAVGVIDNTRGVLIFIVIKIYAIA